MDLMFHLSKFKNHEYGIGILKFYKIPYFIYDSVVFIKIPDKYPISIGDYEYTIYKNNDRYPLMFTIKYDEMIEITDFYI